MADFINLTCPSCGGKLQITQDVERFSCSYCGNEQIVRRSGGIVTISPVVEELKEVKAGVDKTASELAINRLQGELNVLFQQRAAVSGSSGCILSLGITSFVLWGMVLVLWLFYGFTDSTTLMFLVISAASTMAYYYFSNNEKKWSLKNFYQSTK